ncbi:SMI1/KNR4 family protein [Dinghuibacter silviterrae]|uniref:SMI1/KNR4 family protein SUKH-1 n=1 Tax=Dinghuibacter silviterrae TaxID=1539049 RepID=A0A4R8DJB3_9BACT|nr:SMI1/KNR4 family protein [Dinghuibacter silviterrae]TDW97276.1 SMI1/KNR4 family protein SUKH-1 [Dinghuibacter silviterrae]
MSNISRFLDELLQQLIKSGSPLANELQAGIDKSAIETEVSKFEIALPEEVYDLYSWRNGLNSDYLESNKLGALELFRLAVFPPFEVAMEDYEQYSQKNVYWEKEMFPLFGSGGGDYYLINCGQNSEEKGMIFYYSPSNYEFDGSISIFDSLETLIQSVTVCYEERAYWFGSDRYLEIDYTIEAEICQARNPLSAYWRLDKS